MHTKLIAVGAVAAALAFNSVATFAEDHLKPARTNSGQEGITIEGKLVTLHAYLKKGDHASSTGTNLTSPPPARPDASRPGTPAALGKERSDSPSSSTRDQADRQGSRVTAAPSDTSPNKVNPESSSRKTFVLIAELGGIQNAPAVATRSTSSQAPFGQPRADQHSLPSSATIAEGGLAYILFFGDDSSGQAAYFKARGMITDGSSNWSASDGEALDRLQVRGKDDADSSERRDDARAQQPFANSSTGRTGEKDPAVKGSKDASHVKVTGKMLSRGGIQAIQVSEISLASMQKEPATSNPGNADRNRPNPDNDKKRE